MTTAVPPEMSARSAQTLAMLVKVADRVPLLGASTVLHAAGRVRGVAAKSALTFADVGGIGDASVILLCVPLTDAHGRLFEHRLGGGTHTMAPSAAVTCLVIRQAVRARERYTAPCCSVFNVVAGFLCICICNKPGNF